MNEAIREVEVVRAASRLFKFLRAPQSRAPYDFMYHDPPGPPLYVKTKTPIGASVTLDDQQVSRLAALGSATFWINGVLIPLRSLRGVAHRHVHALNGNEKTVVFRISTSGPLPPKNCFGKCEGPLP